MIFWLRHIDHSLFFFINNGLSSSLMDDVFVALSSLGSWTVILITFALLFHDGARKLRLHFVSFFGVGLVVLMVLLNSKSLIGFDRPLRVYRWELYTGQVTINLPEGKTPGNKGLPSGHTTMAFFALVYASRFKPKARFPLYLLASSIGFARIYVGAHFPSDCLVGAVLGTGGALLAAWVFGQIERKLCRLRTQT